MEIKVKLNEVLNINNTLKAIIDDKTFKDAVLKFRFLGIMKTLDPYITNFDVIKNEKILEYGKENNDGVFQISKEDTEAMEKFKNDIEQVLFSEVTINIDLLRPDEIFDKGLMSDYLMGLYPIIKES